MERSYANISPMPIIRSAIKKLRKDRVRTARNKIKKNILKDLIKKARLQKTDANLKAAFSALDKAAKTNLIHKRKASRLKSRLSKGAKKKVAKKPTKT